MLPSKNKTTKRVAEVVIRDGLLKTYRATKLVLLNLVKAPLWDKNYPLFTTSN